MTREALKKLNEKQMNYCKTLSALIDRAGYIKPRIGRGTLLLSLQTAFFQSRATGYR